MAVSVVVQKGASGAPAGLLIPEPSRFRNNRKGAVPIVTVEDVLTEAGHKNILESVVIVVTDAYATGPAGEMQTRFLSHIRKGSIAIVLVKAIGGPWWRPFQAGSRQNEQIHPSVIV